MQLDAKPAPLEEVQRLVGDGTSYEDDPPMSRSLSIKSLMQGAAASLTGVSPQPLYAEEVSPSLIDDAASEEMLVKSQLSNIGSLPVKERARTGAKLGAQLGLQGNGAIGALIGAGVGGMAARALGVIQSGEHEDNLRKEKVLQTMAAMGIVDSSGQIDFEDLGKSPLLTNDPSMRLANMSSFGEGKDRSLYEIDPSNPFANRATTAARPLALYMSQGLLGYRDRKNPRDEQTAKNSLGLLTNSILEGADSDAKIYGRARKLVDKYGLDEDKMRRYFDANKSMYSSEEAQSIRAGLDTIFGRSK
jgi:hypothetical protein